MMNHSESIKELAAALAKAQGEMEGAPKDKNNQFGGHYADLGSVIQAAKKPLTSNGLSITQHPELSDGQVSITSLLMHSSGEWLESSISAPIGDNRALSAAQQAGIVITYLRRYSYAAIVGIYADEDTDGAPPAPPAPARQQQRPAQPARPPAPAPTLPPLTKPEPINGNGNTPAPQAEANWKPADDKPLQMVMTYEEACAVKDKRGKFYKDAPDNILENISVGIETDLMTPGLSPEHTELLRTRLEAVTVIQAYRAAQLEAKPA